MLLQLSHDKTVGKHLKDELYPDNDYKPDTVGLGRQRI